VGWVAEKEMKHLSKIGIIIVFILTGTIGKGVLTAERFSLPDFSFLKVNQVFEDNDFDPRNGNGQVPLNLEEAKRNLCQIFYSGLVNVLKNRDLPIITETLHQIEKVLDLTTKVLCLPFTVYRLPFVPAILPTLKDLLEKLFKTINRITTIFNQPEVVSPLLLYTLHFTLYTFCFLTLLTLSNIILRL
jgi:hypothetical protein